MAMNKTNEPVDYKRTVINGQKSYGKHLVMTAGACNDRLLELSTMSELLRTLVPKIDVTAYGEPLVARFEDGVDVGMSGVQFITTNAIMAHTNDAKRDVYPDVFNRKWFDEAIVREVVENFFAPDEFTEQIVLR